MHHVVVEAYIYSRVSIVTTNSFSIRLIVTERSNLSKVCYNFGASSCEIPFVILGKVSLRKDERCLKALRK